MSLYYCYLLRSLNPQSRGEAYIGFSITPSHRLRQHNGEISAGAEKTSHKRPWIHVLIVGGFPNKYTALQFEWQWQHPYTSRILSGLLNNDPNKPQRQRRVYGMSRKGIDRRNHGGYKNKISILCALLQHPLWAQLNLTIYVVDETLRTEIFKLLNKHNVPKNITCCNISPEAVSSLKSTDDENHQSQTLDFLATHVTLHPTNAEEHILDLTCTLCDQTIQAKDYLWVCIHCEAVHHLRCSASHSLQQEITATTHPMPSLAVINPVPKKRKPTPVKNISPIHHHPPPIVTGTSPSQPPTPPPHFPSPFRATSTPTMPILPRPPIDTTSATTSSSSSTGCTPFSTAFRMIPRYGKCSVCQKQWLWTLLIRRFAVQCPVFSTLTTTGGSKKKKKNSSPRKRKLPVATASASTSTSTSTSAPIVPSNPRSGATKRRSKPSVPSDGQTTGGAAGGGRKKNKQSKTIQSTTILQYFSGSSQATPSPSPSPPSPPLHNQEEDEVEEEEDDDDADDDEEAPQEGYIFSCDYNYDYDYHDYDCDDDNDNDDGGSDHIQEQWEDEEEAVEEVEHEEKDESDEDNNASPHLRDGYNHLDSQYDYNYDYDYDYNVDDDDDNDANVDQHSDCDPLEEANESFEEEDMQKDIEKIEERGEVAKEKNHYFPMNHSLIHSCKSSDSYGNYSNRSSNSSSGDARKAGNNDSTITRHLLKSSLEQVAVVDLLEVGSSQDTLLPLPANHHTITSNNTNRSNEKERKNGSTAIQIISLDVEVEDDDEDDQEISSPCAPNDHSNGQEVKVSTCRKELPEVAVEIREAKTTAPAYAIAVEETDYFYSYDYHFPDPDDNIYNGEPWYKDEEEQEQKVLADSGCTDEMQMQMRKEEPLLHPSEAKPLQEKESVVMLAEEAQTAEEVIVDHNLTKIAGRRHCRALWEGDKENWQATGSNYYQRSVNTESTSFSLLLPKHHLTSPTIIDLSQ